ncbi:hypothetical protein EST38_g5007 [Candolleomyces aberdarensis]|uniref:Uncharacterized protein n=1 Tax=Candolleomyces aberdarensis TaxID=2316362 RepID=A0A4Q2DLK3_9AGAR|nr:hypothetical protein EST38_g5007 [Candolleomyces aberdarensis]
MISAAILLHIRDPANGIACYPTTVKAKLGEFLNWPKIALAVIIRHPHRILPKANDIGSAISCQIDNKTRMFINSPPSGAVSEVADDEFGGLEGPISISNRHENTCIPEPYDISTPVAVDISKKSRMLVDLPLSSMFKCTEVLDSEFGVLEGPITVIQHDVHPIVCEANDISSPIPVRFPSSDEHMVFAKRDDIRDPIATNVSQEPEMSIQPPASSIKPKVIEDEACGCIGSVSIG